MRSRAPAIGAVWGLAGWAAVSASAAATGFSLGAGLERSVVAFGVIFLFGWILGAAGLSRPKGPSQRSS